MTELHAIYTGVDTEILQHGRKYHLVKNSYKNGHVLAKVEVDGLPEELRIRYTSEKAYRRDWQETF